MISRLLIAGFLLLSSAFAHAAPQQPVTADEYCMAINVYYEARFEPEKGMRGVAYVTQNRHLRRKQSVCHVVFAHKQFSWVEQYHVLNEQGHIKDEFRPKASDKRWQLCLQLAREVIAQPREDFTQGAEYFVASYIMPWCLKHSCKWIYSLDFRGQWGVHMFFAEKTVRRKYV